MPYSYKLNVFLTQTGVVLFLKVAHSPPPPPEMAKFPPGGNSPQVGDHWPRLYSSLEAVREGEGGTGRDGGGWAGGNSHRVGLIYHC